MTIDETIIKLLINNPFYGNLASRMSIKEKSDINSIIVKTSPTPVIYYNKEWFLSLDSNEKIGCLLHELIHLVLLHSFRRQNREGSLWSVACDIVVNQFLPPNYRLSKSITLDIISKEIHKELHPFKSAEFYYAILEQLEEKLTLGGGSDREVIIILESKQELKSDIIEDEDISTADLGSLKSDIVNSMEQFGLEHESAAELIQLFNQTYHENIISWRVILKRFLSAKGKVSRRKSYKKISRRYDFLPGNIRSQGVTALVALDESGSIPDSVVDIYLKELKEINRITGVSIMVTRFDTHCSEPEPLNRFILNKGREKQGGTDFRPIFEMADKTKIPLVIIFTDGDGKVPHRVSQKVLWVLTGGGKNPADFGQEIFFTN